MRHTRWIEFFYRILPFYSWKDALIRGHVERCPDCGRRLATPDEARRALVQAGGVGDTERLRRAVANEIAGLDPSLVLTPGRKGKPETSGIAVSPAKTAWRWAAAAGGLFLAVFVTFALVRYFQSTPASGALAAPDSGQFQINYVRIADEPAQTFIFKPHDSDVVIVWAGKTQ
jgi:anti-sigma factor RsiW